VHQLAEAAHEDLPALLLAGGLEHRARELERGIISEPRGGIEREELRLVYPIWVTIPLLGCGQR
jgi:hypothetical protein